MQNRDVVVVGGSAGAVEPMRTLVAGLQPDLPASVFIVLHMSPRYPSGLPDLLARAGPLPAFEANGAKKIEHGKIYVASPDRHLLIQNSHVSAVDGPKENRHRPSIDVLFRSAAVAYGSRVIGVVLSGSLDDGTAGLVAIKIRGGLAVVQDPAEAFSAEMPRNAMRYLEVDHVSPAKQLGPLLSVLTAQPADSAALPPPPDMTKEMEIADLGIDTINDQDRPGKSSVIACPDCHGVLWEIQEGNLLRFRCRTGHAYSPETLLESQDENIEDALWEALRALEERVALRQRLVQQARERRLTSLAEQFEQQVAESKAMAESLRKVLLRRRASTSK